MHQRLKNDKSPDLENSDVCSRSRGHVRTDTACRPAAPSFGCRDGEMQGDIILQGGRSFVKELTI